MAKRRANGEGNIRKRKDGRWEGRYTAGHDPETGRAIIKNVLGKTQAEVKEKLKRAIEETAGVDIARSDSYTVGEWVQTWFELYSKPNVRPNTAAYYRRHAGAAKRRGRKNGILYAGSLRRGLHAPHLCPCYRSDAGGGGGKAGHRPDPGPVKFNAKCAGRTGALRCGLVSRVGHGVGQTFAPHFGYDIFRGKQQKSAAFL